MKLYFVRHGETDMNARNMFYGWTDADINAKGISQAEELREAFRDIHLDAIYSSDLKRALHTAQIIADGRPIETMPDLRELYYGKWENRTWEEMTEEDRAEWKKWNTDWVDCVMPEGEAFLDFYDRVTEGLDRIIRENKGKHVLVVSHNGALSAMHCHLTGAGPKAFWNFNSKQGHYSAVWVSERKLTYDCLNYPFQQEKTENVYIDINSAPDDSLAYLLHGDHPMRLIWTGTKLEGHHENEEHIALLKKHLDFIFLEKDEPCPNWYAVPALHVFAKDSKGGWFAKRKNEEGIYSISCDGTITYLARDLREYLQRVIFEQESAELQKFAEEMSLKKSESDLRRFVCPAYDIRLFADKAEAEKQFYLHELSEFMNVEPQKTIYYNSEKIGKAPEIEGYDVFPAGKRFDPFVMTCEENGFMSLQRKRGIHLIFEGNIPAVNFYPVPSLTIFAHDGKGGYFAYAGKNMMENPVYYISEKLECWFLGWGMREWIQMVVFEPDWKEQITGETAAIHESEEELADFGMLFGLSALERKLSERIRREPYYKIYENIEKAREEMCIL